MKSENEYSGDARRACDDLMKISLLSEKLSQIERVPRYTDGDRENDAEHSYHLALCATEIAASYYLEMDSGLVTQFSLVHDLVEVYTGDVATFGISDESRRRKEQAEEASLGRLVNELPAYLSSLLVRYEQQVEPEARLVRYIDKIMPSFINIISYEVATFLEDHGVIKKGQFDEIIQNNHNRLKKAFPELPFISELMRIAENDLRVKFLDKLK